MILFNFNRYKKKNNNINLKLPRNFLMSFELILSFFFFKF